MVEWNTDHRYVSARRTCDDIFCVIACRPRAHKLKSLKLIHNLNKKLLNSGRFIEEGLHTFFDEAGRNNDGP